MYLLSLFEKIVSRDDALFAFQIRRHAFLTGIGRSQLWHRVQKSEEGSVAIEGSDVEQQLPSFEREEERAKGGYFFQPRRQVGGHDDYRILQLPVHLRRQL